MYHLNYNISRGKYLHLQVIQDKLLLLRLNLEQELELQSELEKPTIGFHKYIRKLYQKLNNKDFTFYYICTQKSRNMSSQDYRLLLSYQMQSENFYERFIEGSYEIRNNIRRNIDMMKKIQFKVAKLQRKVKQQQIIFKGRVKQLMNSNGQAEMIIPQQMYTLFQQILKDRAEIQEKSLNKKRLASHLNQEIQNYYNILNNEYQLKYNKNDDGQKSEREIDKSQRKKGKKPLQLYCYCRKKEYGEMVGCQNTYCQNVWFHRNCVQDKILPELWFCKDCKMQLLKLQKIKAKGLYKSGQA